MSYMRFSTGKRFLEIYSCGHYCGALDMSERGGGYCLNESESWIIDQHNDSEALCPTCSTLADNWADAYPVGCDFCMIRITAVIGWEKADERHRKTMRGFRSLCKDSGFRDDVIQSLKPWPKHSS